MTGEAQQDEFKQEAIWSYRANVPTVGKGEDRRAVPFDEWYEELTRIEEEPEITEITDEEIEWALKAGRQGLRPPGM